MYPRAVPLTFLVLLNAGTSGLMPFHVPRPNLDRPVAVNRFPAPSRGEMLPNVLKMHSFANILWCRICGTRGGE